jgi:hypothetical protein
MARVTNDWKSVGTKSLFGLFILVLVVVPFATVLALSRH